jgi:hypothetical protein
MTLIPLLSGSIYDQALTFLGGVLLVNQEYTHQANFIMEFTVNTLPGSGGIMLSFRAQDANNRWALYITAAGNIYLYEYVTGSPTSRASASGAVSNGSRVTVAATDETITAYVDGTQAWTYTSAANFKTETTGKIVSLSSGAEIANLYLWLYAASILGALT